MTSKVLHKDDIERIDERYEALSSDHSWIDTLIRQYDITKQQLEDYRATLDKNELPEKPKHIKYVDMPNSEEKNEHRIVGEMISDLQYSLEFMSLGRAPGARRGYDKRSVYQRTVLLDTDLFPSLMIEPEVQEKQITRDQKRMLVDVLWKLSNRERQCYILHHAYRLSQREIADELKITRRTVRSCIERATSKILDYKARKSLTF